jgi:hypothetical protein
MDDDQTQMPDDWREVLNESGIDFGLAAKVLKEVIHIQVVEAEKTGEVIYCKPDYSRALTAFYETPSAATAIALLECGPSESLLGLFAGCAPGGMFKLFEDVRRP